MDFWISIVFPLLMALGFALWESYRRWGSSMWAGTEIFGTVEQHVKIIRGGGNRENIRHGVAYSYQVNGEFYSGEMVADRLWGFPRTEDDVVRLYPRGAHIRVRYKPNNPSISVALPAEIPPKSVYFPPRDEPR